MSPEEARQNETLKALFGPYSKLNITALPTATKWVKERVKQWGPFEEIKRDSTHVFVRGLTRKPNGEEWIGWLPIDQIEVS